LLGIESHQQEQQLSRFSFGVGQLQDARSFRGACQWVDLAMSNLGGVPGMYCSVRVGVTQVSITLFREVHVKHLLLLLTYLEKLERAFVLELRKVWKG
jgi:hypothetical protein